MKHANISRVLGIVALGALAIGAGPTSVLAGGDSHDAPITRLLMPIMDSEKGMKLFVEKGCYSCHSVNGVGGHDAAALDAHEMDEFMNPFDLAAKMWRMAPIMIPAQESELGAQIEFTGEELADIIAFLHDDAQQHKFTENVLTPDQRAALHAHGGGESGDEAHENELGHTHGGSDGDGDADDHSDG